MTSKAEFIRLIEDDISVSCGLPIKLPCKEIERIMKVALNWFYQHYEDALQEIFIIIPSQIYTTPEFKTSRVIKLPESIFSVTGVNEINGGILTKYYRDPDMSIERFVMQDIYPGLTGNSVFYYTTSQLFMQSVRAVFLNTIKFDFNKNTHRLRLSGKLPDQDIVVSAYQKVDEHFMYDDDYYYRYVLAYAKKQLARLLGTFQFPLVGGASINYDIIKEEGKEELQKIEEEIKSNDVADWFYLVD